MDVRLTLTTSMAAPAIGMSDGDRGHLWARDEKDRPLLGLSHVRGWCKDACAFHPRPRSDSAMLAKHGVSSCRRLVGNAVSIHPLDGAGPHAPLIMPEGTETHFVKRRWHTEASECVPAGTHVYLRFSWKEPVSWSVSMESAIREWLTLGRRRGLLRWRDEGFGRFVWHDLAMLRNTSEEGHG